jgi:hypothetical protein
MDGDLKISTLDVITKAQLFAFSELKMEIALEVIHLHCGQLITIMVANLIILVTMKQCYLTFLATVISHLNKQERIFIGIDIGDLLLEEKVVLLS